ncbi:MAG TPA: winged helix-turn-helix domain-containing protein [Nitrososphaera sp.]|nr:winged helix-turn-helix domain-containing protein [Nitrososphaera sp.]
MRNRQKDEIMKDIIHTAQGGAGITKIMFHAYLTHCQARDYSNLLVENGLLELVSNGGSIKQYRSTPRGLEFLAAVERMTEILPIPTRRAINADSFLL